MDVRYDTLDQSMAATNRILIADDNAQNCELLEAYLAELDCDVAIAVDGQDTMDKVLAGKTSLAEMMRVVA